MRYRTTITFRYSRKSNFLFSRETIPSNQGNSSSASSEQLFVCPLSISLIAAETNFELPIQIESRKLSPSLSSTSCRVWHDTNEIKNERVFNLRAQTEHGKCKGDDKKKCARTKENVKFLVMKDWITTSMNWIGEFSLWKIKKIFKCQNLIMDASEEVERHHLNFEKFQRDFLLISFFSVLASYSCFLFIVVIVVVVNYRLP